jgi:hypothetical protein
MLDTLLQIGEVLKIENPVDTYRYFVELPKSNSDLKRKVSVYRVLLNKDFDFTVNSATEIVGNVGTYFRFKFKTSESDSTLKYVCGDIYFSLIKKENKKEKTVSYEENKAYQTGRLKSKSCFENIKKAELELFLSDDSEIGKFRDAFKKNLEEVENFLYEKAIENFENDKDLKESGVILHFDFSFDDKGENWFEREKIVKPIKNAVTRVFFEEQGGKYVLNKSLYHAVGSHQEDSQFPNFTRSNQYKTRAFSKEQAESLFHSIKFVKDKDFGFNIKDIKIAVLPKGEKKNLTAKLLLDFFNSNSTDFSDKNLDDVVKAEKTFSRILSRRSDPILDKLTENVPQEITHFDLIFIDTSGQAIIDSVELSGIEKSLLSQIRAKVKASLERTYEERQRIGKKTPEDFETITVANAFKHILEIPFDDKKKGYDEKKYQAYLLKTLPKIYSDTYQRDSILLNWFIENVEIWIRRRKYEDAQEHFIFTRFDWMFLNDIQKEGRKYMSDLIGKDDYNIGVKLGDLCRPVSFKKGSFTATHAGMLTRRVSTVEGLQQFVLEVYEILCRNKLATTERRKTANELLEFIKNLQEKDYDKFRLGLGFFESYFKQKQASDDLDEEQEAENEEENESLETQTMEEK